jgi:excisionase family DNA binding protein
MATLENDGDEAQPDGDMRAPSRFVTARELAELLGVSTETVLRWTRDGKLPGFRMPGGALRYRDSDLALWLSERATDRPRPKPRRATAAVGRTVARNSRPEKAGGDDRAVHSTRSGVQAELW